MQNSSIMSNETYNRIVDEYLDQEDQLFDSEPVEECDY